MKPQPTRGKDFAIPYLTQDESQAFDALIAEVSSGNNFWIRRADVVRAMVRNFVRECSDMNEGKVAFVSELINQKGI